MDQVRLPRIIGLCGDIGSGKSTVAKFLWEEYGYGAASFAAKLKAVAKDVFGLTDEQVNGTQAEKAAPIPHVMDRAGNPRSARFILEYLGTEGFRAIDPYVWVDYAMRKVDQHSDGSPGSPRWVFQDVRVPNEFEAIRDRDGVVWEVVRDDKPPFPVSTYDAYTSCYLVWCGSDAESGAAVDAVP